MVYYLFVGMVALLSLASGFMFWSSIGLLAVFAAPIYASLVVGFAAVTGWHAGRIIDRFEHAPEPQDPEGSTDPSGPTFESEIND